ncbi:MAG: iron hydrogenase small subunit [Phycisphaerae bacterium]|nr:iron hydrogenase small subunit [Phycisphaerae bacterium]
MENLNTLILDGKEVVINNEKNVLELARANGITIPTFCYHSELSVYGACRLCLVDIEGKGITTSCSTKAEPGMVIKTNTAEIRKMRKMTLELLLANHDMSCPTCKRSANCKLQDLARQMGITEIRFKKTHKPKPIDTSSESLVRDPNKCILCGDCVRACREIQSIGAIDFAHRGANVEVLPSLGHGLGKVECVNCGQCAAVCPVGALYPKSHIDQTWDKISDKTKTVVVQVAPAVRVALGEQFGMEPGQVSTGQMVAALKTMGFDQVYDTSFAADLTVIEEANEFIKRKLAGEKLPQFTSCCPGWVKFAELYYPDLLDNLSSCKSPQQMFGSLAKELLPEKLGVKKEDLVVISIMPCTAKKAEANREEFKKDNIKDVDYVLTTQELATMIQQSGLEFNELQPESFDMPFGFKTGAGVIFGTTGGVTEAVLRYAGEKIANIRPEDIDFKIIRSNQQLREAEYTLGDVKISLAVVHGLRNTRAIAKDIQNGTCKYDLIEVMACPGGCIGGAGQPINNEPDARKKRTKGLYNVDKMLQLHTAQDNHIVSEIYDKELGEPNSPKAHELLHTHYHSQPRLVDSDVALTEITRKDAVKVQVCVGTNCFVKGSQDLLKKLIHYVEENNLTGLVDVSATFCLKKCGQGPNVAVDNEIISGCDFQIICDKIESKINITS